MRETKTRTKTETAIETRVAVVRTLRAAKRDLSTREIAREIDYDSGRTLRALRSLEADGYVESQEREQSEKVESVWRLRESWQAAQTLAQRIRVERRGDELVVRMPFDLAPILEAIVCRMYWSPVADSGILAGEIADRLFDLRGDLSVSSLSSWTTAPKVDPPEILDSGLVSLKIRAY